MQFEKATRKGAIVRIAIIGPAKGGKTYTSLMLAHGMDLPGRTALIDTERGSARMYANEFDFDVLELGPPYTPERYIEAIREAEQEHSIVIIDSLSHAWAGTGGILDMHDRMTDRSSSKNSYTSWGKVTPLHNQLMDAIMGSSIHVIATMRTKTAYEQVKDGSKMKPVKIGLAPVQRDGVDYEFDTIITMSPDRHVATCDQDRTHLFEQGVWTPTIEDGKKLAEWLTQSSNEQQRIEKESLDALNALIASAENLIEGGGTVEQLKAWWEGVSKEDVTELTKEHKRELGRFVKRLRNKVQEETVEPVEQ